MSIYERKTLDWKLNDDVLITFLKNEDDGDNSVQVTVTYKGEIIACGNLDNQDQEKIAQI